MANLLYLPNLDVGVKVLRGQFQQIGSDLLQRLQFLGGHVGPLVFLKAEDEEPSVTLVRRHQCPRPAALSPAG